MDKITHFNGISVYATEEAMDKIEDLIKVFTTEHGGEIIVDGRGLDEDTLNEISAVLDVDASLLEDKMISIYS